jgi:hypothetical protein
MQAKSFKAGLDINPSDRMMHQAFWDAMALLSQNRMDSITLHSLTSVPHDMSAGMHSGCYNARADSEAGQVYF